MYFDQQEFDVRFEWGLAGIEALAPVSDVIVIVDVLSSSTSVDVAVGNGASSTPIGARRMNSPRLRLRSTPRRSTRDGNRPMATRWPLPHSQPSPAARGPCCLRPTAQPSRWPQVTCRRWRAVCAMPRPSRQRAAQLGRRISVIAAGERWPGPLPRPAREDLLGAGAIIERLAGNRSPEADMAAAAFRHAEPSLDETLLRCGSGKELVGRGFAEDVHIASG